MQHPHSHHSGLHRKPPHYSSPFLTFDSITYVAAGGRSTELAYYRLLGTIVAVNSDEDCRLYDFNDHIPVFCI